MKIALLGYGKMGKLIEEAATERGHQIVCKMTSSSQSWNEIRMADLCIDFSEPEAVIGHLEQAGLAGKNFLVGTTGWESRLEEAKSIVEKFGIGILYAPNFSLGIYLFLTMLEHSAELMNRFTEYGVAGIEMHHAQKKDAPSGTALEMARRVKKKMDRIDQLDISSVRVGSIPGIHKVIFDSPCDSISITHEARSRIGFAKGAVAAAEWLAGKKGFYTLEDFVKGILS